MSPREHSTEGKAAQNLDGRIRKARRREDAPPEADDWAIHLGRYDVYLWNAWKMVPVQLADANYYLTQHPLAEITTHPRARFALEDSRIVELRPMVALDTIRKELNVK